MNAKIKVEDARVKLLARELAKHYKVSNFPESRACACVGLKCYETSCSGWWEFFLKNYSLEDIKRMVISYRTARGED